jgi:pseudouridine synthase
VTQVGGVDIARGLSPVCDMQFDLCILVLSMLPLSVYTLCKSLSIPKIGLFGRHLCLGLRTQQVPVPYLRLYSTSESSVDNLDANMEIIDKSRKYGGKKLRTKKKLLSSTRVKVHRLERIISNRGYGSRNEVAKLLRSGRVTVNDKIIRSSKNKYPIDIDIKIDGEALQMIPLLALYHKPIGVHSTMKDNHGRDSLQELMLEYPFLKSMHPVGRLDADTSGLLLFSSDGQLTNTLLQPFNMIEREYEAVVTGEVDYEKLKKKLENGVVTTDGKFKANLSDCQLLDTDIEIPKKLIMKAEAGLDECSKNDSDDERESRAVKRIESQFKTVPNNPSMLLTKASYVRLAVTEGKYRMVRRILHNAGHSVINLHRIRYGNILLNDLEEGEVTSCDTEQSTWAKRITNANESKDV